MQHHRPEIDGEPTADEASELDPNSTPATAVPGGMTPREAAPDENAVCETTPREIVPSGTAPGESGPTDTGSSESPGDVPAAEPDQSETFTERHRLPLGLAGAVFLIGVAVFFFFAGSALLYDGWQSTVLRWVGPLCWLLLASVAVTWALRAPRKVTTTLGYITLGCYLLNLGLRLL